MRFLGPTRLPVGWVAGLEEAVGVLVTAGSEDVSIPVAENMVPPLAGRARAGARSRS